MSQAPVEFKNVTALTTANVYFEGKVVSHTLLLADGSKKTLGLIYPGSYHFGTQLAEQMDITAGQCRVRLDSEESARIFPAGQSFQVRANSGFQIEVESGICQYICSFLPS
jgi:uncharacterized protein YaiE (UPF0345 family)